MVVGNGHSGKVPCVSHDVSPSGLAVVQQRFEVFARDGHVAVDVAKDMQQSAGFRGEMSRGAVHGEGARGVPSQGETMVRLGR
ncbi:MAG: hypothetical protein ACJAZO_000534 [Myxococcota bacterium]|jgi:hypothetical protein